MGSPITDWYAKHTPPMEADISSEERERCAYIDNQLKSSEMTRIPFLRQAQTGISLYNTETQWFEWSDRERRMREIPKQDWQKRITANYTAPAVDTIAAVLTNTQPGWEVTAATSEDEDVEAAKACEKLLEHVYRECKMASKMFELVKWAELTGIGWLNVSWDYTRGEEYDEPAEGPSLDSTPIHELAEGELPEPRELTEGDSAEHKPYGWELQDEQPQTTRRRTGFPVITVVPPMSIATDPGGMGKDLDDCRWIAHTAYLHLDDIHAKWPARAALVKPDTAFGEDSYAQTILANIQGGPGGQNNAQAHNPDRVRVVSYYERPSPRHPLGYFAVKAGNVLLDEQEELPCGGALPFVCVRFNPVPGRLWGQGLVSRIEQQQRTLNYQLSKLLEMVGLHAAPKWAMEKGSLRQSAITNRPGEVLEYERTSQPPRVIPPPPISPEHRTIAQECANMIQQISGIGEITQGVVPPGISGRAAGIMQEADAAKRQPVVRELAEALESLGRMVLELWRDCMPIDVTIRTVGNGGKLQAMAFAAGNIRSTDVRIDMSSMAIKHPTIAREQIMQAFERGMLGDPGDPETRARAMRGLELPGVDDETQGNDPEESYAREVAFSLLQGQPVIVHPWEDHAAHIRVLKKLLQTSVVRHVSPEVLQSITQSLADRYAYQAAATGQPLPPGQWWTKYASQDALSLFAPSAPPEAPQGPAPTSPDMGQAPQSDAFGLPPDAAEIQMANAGTRWDPSAPPPIPTGAASMGIPVGGPGVPSVTTAAELAQPQMGA